MCDLWQVVRTSLDTQDSPENPLRRKTLQVSYSVGNSFLSLVENKRLFFLSLVENKRLFFLSLIENKRLFFLSLNKRVPTSFPRSTNHFFEKDYNYFKQLPNTDPLTVERD